MAEPVRTKQRTDTQNACQGEHEQKNTTNKQGMKRKGSTLSKETHVAELGFEFTRGAAIFARVTSVASVAVAATTRATASAAARVTAESAETGGRLGLGGLFEGSGDGIGRYVEVLTEVFDTLCKQVCGVLVRWGWRSVCSG